MLNRSYLNITIVLYCTFAYWFVAKYNLNINLLIVMQSLLIKCFLVSCLSFTAKPNMDYHPLFISVTEIEHNAKDKSLEISCKIFTDDFERALRATYKTKIDLIDGLEKVAMNKLVDDYVRKHLSILVDGKATTLKFLGFEKIEEAIYSYFEVPQITSVSKITITDDLLYEYKNEQISLLHVTVKGKRQSTKLSNPEKVAIMQF
jgi:hypothetical protein